MKSVLGWTCSTRSLSFHGGNTMGSTTDVPRLMAEKKTKKAAAKRTTRKTPKKAPARKTPAKRVARKAKKK